MNPGTLLIRADASAATGTGHIMRCLALAQSWQDAGGLAVVAVAEATPATEERVRREGIEIVRVEANPGSDEDARLTAELARDRGATWVVLDGYRFHSAYQAVLKACGFQVLLIDDDVHADRYVTDLVLNQNLHATESLYEKREPGTRLLFGPRYALLRREFDSWRKRPREMAAIGRRVLVTMGGSDPDNFTLRVLQALALTASGSLEAVVVAGGSNPHARELEEAAAELTARHAVRVVKNVSNMPELMAWADVAVSAAGSTCWEMCLLGLPALVVDLAKNQAPVAKSLDELGVARHVGSSADCSAAKITTELANLLGSSETRNRMSTRGKELVDGRGASRVIDAMLNREIRVRRVTEPDCRLLWNWANEPGVRAAAFSQQAIGWEEHLAWFQAKMADQNCTMVIGETGDGQAVGQVRIDRQSSGDAEIGVSIARDFRGAGYGSLLIDAALREVSESGGITKVHAYIRPENRASVRAFEKAGFHRVGETQVRGNPAVHYCREMPPRSSQR